MTKIRRIYIYEDTYKEVMAWAKDEFKIFQYRAPNGKPISENFPYALSEYLKRKR